MLELFDEVALLDRLRATVARGKRSLTFLVGSPITAPLEAGETGVPNVNGMIEQVQEALKALGVGTPGIFTSYQHAFQALLGRGGPDAVNRAVRTAVLRAAVDQPAEILAAASDGTGIEVRRACDMLERSLAGWSLSPGVKYLGLLAATFPRSFGKAVLTSNFDPLIEVSIQRAGGICWRTAPQGDGSLLQSRGRGCHVVHVHGYWYDADTLHTPTQLEAERPQLRASLRRLFEDTTLVVVAYGGWNDVFTKALLEVIGDGGAFPEVIWTFFEADAQAITINHSRLLERLRPGLERAGRVTLYGGVDCHTFFQKLWECLPASVEMDEWAVQTSSREGISGDLNKMADRLARLSGVDFTTEIVASLEVLCTNHLRPGCRVAVIPELDERDLLFRARSDSLTTDMVNWLVQLSGSWKGQLRPWSAAESVSIIGRPLGLAGVAIPLVFPGQSFGGHLFLLHESPFSPAEISLLFTVAHTLAALLKAERDRIEMRAYLGRFRHSILGPVQGLASAARLLAREADTWTVSGEKSKIWRSRIAREVEAIRLWREIDRVLARDELKVVARGGDLRILLETCCARYRDSMAERGIEIVLLSKSIFMDFDASAFDLAVSILIRNAEQYSFSGQAVKVGAVTRGDHVDVWVEDVGHPIPDDLGEKLASYQRRGTILPPAGWSQEGVGLAVAAAVVQAHGGRLSHVCKRVASGSKDVQRYQVRFIIRLPLGRGEK